MQHHQSLSVTTSSQVSILLPLQRVEAAVVKDEAVVPATAGLTTQSVVRVSAEKNLVTILQVISCMLIMSCLVVTSLRMP